MAQWAKIKIFYAGRSMLGAPGSVLTATSTASGYDVKEIYNMLETTMWKAANDHGVRYVYCRPTGQPKAADYLAILDITFQRGRNDSFAIFDGQFCHGYKRCLHGVCAYRRYRNPEGIRGARNQVVLAAQDYRYVIRRPYMTLCIWGNRTRLRDRRVRPHEQVQGHQRF